MRATICYYNDDGTCASSTFDMSEIYELHVYSHETHLEDERVKFKFKTDLFQNRTYTVSPKWAYSFLKECRECGFFERERQYAIHLMTLRNLLEQIYENKTEELDETTEEFSGELEEPKKIEEDIESLMEPIDVDSV